MQILSTSDTIEDSGLQPLFAEMKISSFFKFRNYGNEEIRLFYVIVCIGEDTKQRIRFDTKNNTLYWDVILSYQQVKHASIENRKYILANSIIQSFQIIEKYNKSRKLHIDWKNIQEDGRFYFEGLGWL